MTFRSTVVCSLAVGLALSASPADAASASLQAVTARLGTTATPAPTDVVAPSRLAFKILKVTCTSTAITFTGRTSESGVSGVQQFEQSAREQELQGGRWVDITGTSSAKSRKFPDDPRSFFYKRDWQATHPADGASHRAIWQGFYLDGSGQAISKTKPIPVNCL